MNKTSDRHLTHSQVPVLVEERVKVKTNFNPFQNRKDSVFVDVSRIEDIYVYHKKIREVRRFSDILKDQAIKKRVRKRVAKDVLKHWNREFKSIFKSERAFHLERTAVLKSKKIKLIAIDKITLFGLLSFFLLALSKRWSIFVKFPLIGRLFQRIYQFIEVAKWNNLIVLLTYLSLFTTLYYFVVRSYYNLMRNIGSQAEGYVRKSFKSINRKYREQFRQLKRHVLKQARSRTYQRPLRVAKIYDPEKALNRLDEYIEYLTERMNQFKRHDIILQVGGIVCHLFEFAGIAYFLFGLLFP